MICFICGHQSKCSQSGKHAKVKEKCAAAKSAIWVNVVDDQWTAVPEVPIEIKKERHKTRKNGFAKFDPMNPEEHEAKLELKGDLAKQYDLAVPKRTSKTTLSEGQVNYVLFQLIRRAKLKVEVFTTHGGRKTLDGAKVAIVATRGDNDNGGKEDTAGGIADFKDRSADTYKISAVLKDDDLKLYYAPDAPLSHPLNAGADDTVPYEVKPLARPKVVVVEKSNGKGIGKVNVKLKHADRAEQVLKDTPAATDTVESTGLAELEADKPGIRGGDHEVLLTYDEKIYMKLPSTPKFNFVDGSTDTHEVKLARLARPKFRVLHKTSGKPVDGVKITLTAAKDSAKTNIPKTGDSGNTEIAKGAPGLLPGRYALSVAHDEYELTHDPLPDANFVENDTQTILIKVETPKGAVRFLINRYDGLDLVKHVTFTLALASAKTTILKTETSAARAVVEERESGKVTVKEDWKEVGQLEPDKYELAIKDLKADVLDMQVATQTWFIGPTETGKVEFEVKPGKTTDVRFTIHKYKKAVFVGYSITPGYADGARCPKCFNQYAAAKAKCDACNKTLKPKRCPLCQKLFDAGATECSTCQGMATFQDAVVWCKDCDTEQATWPDWPKCASCAAANGLEDRFNYECGCCGFKGYLTADPKRKIACPNTHKEPLEAERIYLGAETNMKDLLSRCLLVKKAIVTAEAKTPKNEEHLKIFMGPEFFFRGKDGCYPVPALHVIMDTLRAETKDGKYKDWLFVFGTAIGQMPPSESQYTLTVAQTSTGKSVTVTAGPGGKDNVNVCSKVPKDNLVLPVASRWKLGPRTIESVVVGGVNAVISLRTAMSVTAGDVIKLNGAEGVEILNYALVQRGGPDVGAAGPRESIIYKEKVSHIDFLRDESKPWGEDGKADPADRRIYLDGKQSVVLPTEGAADKFSRAVNLLEGEANKSGIGGGSVFMMDGITFGLEVCLDHAEQKLRKYYDGGATGVGKVQIQLIPSWGMSITKKGLAGMAGTLVFNVDGPDGSDAATLDGDPPDPDFTRLGNPTSHPVPEADKETIAYTDHATHPPKDETTEFEPKYVDLVVKHKHRVNRGGEGAEGYAWIDVYKDETIPTAESV